MNPCPSCGSNVDISVTPVCQVCGWDLGGPTATSAVQITVRPAPRPKLPVEVDLAVDIDITGSSRLFAAGILGNIEALLKTIEAKAAGLRVWVQTHGDQDCGQHPTLVLDGGTVAEAVLAAKGLTFDGGGDPPEHHLDAIDALLRIVPFVATPARRGAIVSFTTSDSKPATSGRTPEQIGGDLKARNLITALVCEGGTAMEAVGAASGGFVFQINPSPNPDEMRRVAEQVAASVIATLTKGVTRPLTAVGPV